MDNSPKLTIDFRDLGDFPVLGFIATDNTTVSNRRVLVYHVEARLDVLKCVSVGRLVVLDDPLRRTILIFYYC
jgi:hypothetical protein